MNERKEKISLHLSGLTNSTNARRNSLCATDDVVLRLARLLGRQIAREQVKRGHEKERRDEFQRDRNPNWLYK